MNVMMLAAGEGSRLKPYTLIKPKPAIPFLNIPLAGHALAILKSLEKHNLIVNTHHLSSGIHELFPPLAGEFKNLIFSDEKFLLGSGGGLKNVQNHLNQDHFILMNSDEVIIPKQDDFLNAALQVHLKNQNISTMIVMKHPEAGGKFGAIWTDKENKVRAIGKTRPPQTQPWHFIGVQILSPEIFNYLPESGESNILYDGVINALKDGHQAQVYPLECLWFETGNIVDYWEGTKTCLEILAGDNSWQKDHLINVFNQFDQFTDYQIHQNSSGVSFIHRNSLINPEKTEGYVVAGKNSRSQVEKIKDIVLCNNAFLKTESEDRIIF